MMVDENGGEFHAKLEHEGGVFRAIYRRAKNPGEPLRNFAPEGEEPMIDSHIGADAEAVKAFVETYAKNRGYASVVWE